jgi:hypothetical protein
MQSLSWAPIDDRPPIEYVSRQARVQTAPQVANTECNYLVMFFVAGVFLMALADSMK